MPVTSDCDVLNQQNSFCYNFVKYPSTVIIFGTKMAKTKELCNVHFFLPRVIYVNVLFCETLMFKIVA